jgi:hypothetical protein
MRTVELSDEVFARAEAEAAERGVPVDELVNQVVDKGIPSKSLRERTRLKFPLIPSDRPGTLRITKEMIDAVELEDDLRRSGLSG